MVALAMLLLQAAQLPGPAWQQDLSYRISASLDEVAGAIRGHQEVRYRNASPDTLRVIVFHLHQNARSGGAAASSRIAVSSVLADGSPTVPTWPLAPDSTVMRLELPRPLAPGDSAVISMEWEARLARPADHELPLDRHFDFDHWYPQVAVYDDRGWDELSPGPAGRHYGEFATFLVELDLASDQVVGATGVPICGDPGWEGARRIRAGTVRYESSFYRDARDPEARALIQQRRPCPAGRSGRKTVTWYAEDVHHFAMSMDPEYRYEEGDVFTRPVRALYLPGSARAWGAGLATGRIETALVWLDELFGLYPWPQLTIVERRAAGSRAAPMLVMSGGPGGSTQERILHEVGHNYSMGILANDERRDDWLGDGPTAFQVTLLFESLGRGGGYQSLERQVLDWDLDCLSVPIARTREHFPDSASYVGMVSRRGELFFHQLRQLLGDPTMRQVLRTYFARYRFRHVDADRLRAVVEEISGHDLELVFRQWTEETVLYDYELHRARREQLEDTRWRTTVVARAREEGRFPAEVWVYGAGDSAMARLPGRSAVESVTVVTSTQPTRAAIDPAALSHDWNMTNNQRSFGFLRRRLPAELYLGGWFSQRQRRNRLTTSLAPTAWLNDAGGWTLGLRTRTDYLGRFARNELWLNASTGWSGESARHLNAWLVIRNPIQLAAPGMEQWLEAGVLEGRSVLGVGFLKRSPRILAPPKPVSWGLGLRWLEVREGGGVYLDPSHWSDAATLELNGSVLVRRRSWHADAELSAGRVTDAGPGITRQSYGRLVITVAAEEQLGPVRARVRGFAGATFSAAPLPRQRLFYLAGADPQQRLASPLLRSRGALLVRDGVNYHEPGGANVRGLDPAIAATQAYAVNLELERALLERPGRGVFRRIALALFADGALADGDLDAPAGDALRAVGDAGIGARVDHWIGATPFQTRLDLPLWVSRPQLAQQARTGSSFGWRWSFSFRPSW